MAWLLAMLFLWFFASSITTAWRKAPQHDDVMFASVSKNFLLGKGWSTSYGEPILFNPDISTGPTLWIPCAVMIAVFGTETWTPAMTGALMNVALTLLIIWQLLQQVRFRTAACFALLLSISLFATHDFKTFTAYYTASLLFLLSLLLVLNQRLSVLARFSMFGALAAIGLYAKPLILLSFLAAIPPLLLLEWHKQNIKPFFWLLAGFLLAWAPWHVYKSIELSKLDPQVQVAHEEYSEFFFEHHGTGIAQFEGAENKLAYLGKNTRKNFKILRNFLADENDFPVYLVIAVFFIAVGLFVKKMLVLSGGDAPIDVEYSFAGILAFVALANLFWYVVISFALTPGHAFFLTFFAFFLLFFLLATQARHEWHGVAFCILISLGFQVRHLPLAEAYSFGANDVALTNDDVSEALLFLQHHSPRYPLASCGYAGAPWRMEFLLEGSGHFLDCYNMMEDSLVRDDKAGSFQWGSQPDFTLVVEGAGLLASAKSQAYVLGPVGEACQRHMLFRNNFFIVCEVPFAEIKQQLDPSETARQLVTYRGWYKTRLRPLILDQ